jgi:hypothetical protein
MKIYIESKKIHDETYDYVFHDEHIDIVPENILYFEDKKYFEVGKINENIDNLQIKDFDFKDILYFDIEYRFELKIIIKLIDYIYNIDSKRIVYGNPLQFRHFSFGEEKISKVLYFLGIKENEVYNKVFDLNEKTLRVLKRRQKLKMLNKKKWLK